MKEKSECDLENIPKNKKEVAKLFHRIKHQFSIQAAQTLMLIEDNFKFYSEQLIESHLKEDRLNSLKRMAFIYLISLAEGFNKEFFAVWNSHKSKVKDIYKELDHFNEKRENFFQFGENYIKKNFGINLAEEFIIQKRVMIKNLFLEVSLGASICII